MIINRKDILVVLRAAGIGLTGREVLEQSNSFVFTDGSLVTFNDDIFFRTKSPLDFTMAVPADDFIGLLSKFPDEEVDIFPKGGELIVKGKNRRAGILYSKDIALPIEDIPSPGKWHPLEKGVQKVIRQAAETCGKDYTQILTTMVHVTPDRIEACDNFRFFRASTPTGFPKAVCIPAASIEALSSLLLVDVSIGKGWTHFRTKDHSEVSLRCSHEEYHKGVDKLLKIKNGKKVVLPANLAAIIDRAIIMNEGGYDSRINLHIVSGKLQILSRKDTGWYREKKRVKYSGPDLSFDIHPRFLMEILERTRRVIVGSNRIKIEVGDVQFVAAMTVPEETEGEE